MSRRWGVQIVVVLAVLVAAFAAAFDAATRRARSVMGEALGGPIERVKAVRSQPR